MVDTNCYYTSRSRQSQFDNFNQENAPYGGIEPKEIKINLQIKMF